MAFPTSEKPPSSYHILHGEYLSPTAFENIENYDGYAGGDEHSAFYPYFVPVLEKGLSKLPRGYRPALWTVVVLCMVILSTLVLLGCQWNCAQPVDLTESACYDSLPLWPHALNAIVVLVYMSYGAIETGRVRYTFLQKKNWGPLDAVSWLVWHGSNSVAVGFLVLGATLTLHLRNPTSIVLGTVSGLTTCYVAHWQKYVSGHRKVVSRHVDVLETQLILVGVHVLTVFVGPRVWNITVFNDIQINDIVFAFILFRSTIIILRYWHVILEGGPGEMGTTTAGTGVLSPAIPAVLVVYTSWVFVDSQAFRDSPYATILCVILMYVKVINKLIIAQVSQTPVEQVDVLFVPAIAFRVAMFVGIPLLDNGVFMALYGVLLCANLVLYWVDLTHQVAQRLRVSVFSPTVASPSPLSPTRGNSKRVQFAEAKRNKSSGGESLPAADKFKAE